MEQVVAELSELNRKVEVIVAILKTPENKALKLIGIIASVATIAGILAIVDIVRNWIFGGW